MDWDVSLKELSKVGQNIDGRYVTYGDVGIAGVGSGNWTLALKEKDLKSIKKNFAKMKNKRQVLVSHLHATGTTAEIG